MELQLYIVYSSLQENLVLYSLFVLIKTYLLRELTGRKDRGPQTAGGNRLQVADFFSYTKLLEASFNSVLMTPGSA